MLPLSSCILSLSGLAAYWQAPTGSVQGFILFKHDGFDQTLMLTVILCFHRFSRRRVASHPQTVTTVIVTLMRSMCLSRHRQVRAVPSVELPNEYSAKRNSIRSTRRNTRDAWSSYSRIRSREQPQQNRDRRDLRSRRAAPHRASCSTPAVSPRDLRLRFCLDLIKQWQRGAVSRALRDVSGDCVPQDSFEPRHHVLSPPETPSTPLGLLRSPMESFSACLAVLRGLLLDSLNTPSGLLEHSFETPSSERLLPRLLSGLLSTLL